MDFCESPREQLRSWTTQGQCKATLVGKTNHCIYLPPTPPAFIMAWSQENSQVLAIPLEVKGKSGMCTKHFGILKDFPTVWFLPPLIWSTNGNWHSVDAWGCGKQKWAQCITEALERLRNYRKILRVVKDYEILKNNWHNSWAWKLHKQAEGRGIPKKGLKGL